MTTYKWSELAAGVVIAFDPNADALFIDDLSISAKGLSATDYLAGTSVTFTANGKALTPQTNLKALTTTNLTFADGSLYRIGDNSVGTIDDDGPNTLIGGTGDDRLLGFGGNDTLDGGAGADVAAYGGPLADYRFSVSGGHVVITDTNSGNGDDGADQLISVEAARFSDGSMTITAGTGGEFRVNTYTTNGQWDPAITTLSNGDFVVTWASQFQDGSGYGVYAQRYDAAGMAQGAEFRVSTYTATDQFEPAITTLTSGGFVVTWSSLNQDGSGSGVYAQRYDAAGMAQGAEFRVNTYAADNQQDPEISALPSGGFVVTWTSWLQDGNGSGVYAQRYDAAGMAQGAEFRVNTYAAGNQRHPAISALPSGGFVVTWTSSGQDGSGSGVYAQRYDAAGMAQGAEFRVNTYAADNQQDPAISALPSGGFVVTWTSWLQDGSGWGMYAQRYDAAGVAQGAEFEISTFSSPFDPSTSAISALSEGGFVVTWESEPQDDSSTNVYARRYDEAGVVRGAEFRVNTYTASDQYDPAITALPSGGFVVTWSSVAQDGSNRGVYAQRFDAAGNIVATALSGDAGANTLTWTGTYSVVLEGGAGDDTLSGGAGNDALAGDSGNDAINGGAGNDRLTGGAGDDLLRGDLGVDTALYSGLASAYAISRNGLSTTVSGPDGTDTLVSVERLQFDGGGMRTLEHADRDYGDDGKSDILWRNTNGNVAVWQMEGMTESNGAIVGNATTDWKIVDGSGDYDGNGKSDLLWHNDNDSVAIWQMDGLTVSGVATFSSAPVGWRNADGAGDYNGDGKSDILLRHDNGNVAMWLMNGMAISIGSTFSSASTDWKIADGAGDYNGDGKSDILWRNDDGNVAIWLMDGFNQIGGGIVNSASLGWKIVDGSGDYNGDGKSDILWHNDNGNVGIWQIDGLNMTGGSTFSRTTEGWDIADGSGDHDGDGKSDILLRHDNGNVGMWLMDDMVIATGAIIGEASLDWMIQL